MPLLPASARRETRWKNGGGSTAEIAVSPEGAGLDDFDWRVSMASIERDGPFSLFPGVDRVLSVVEAELILEVFGAPPVTLNLASPPHGFPGDVATFGRLTGGAVVDVNVMTRRGAFVADVTRVDLNAAREIALRGEALLIVLDGDVDFEAPESRARLGPRDAWRGEGGLWRLTPSPSARVVMVEFKAVARVLLSAG